MLSNPTSLQLVLALISFLCQPALSVLFPAFPGEYGHIALQNLTRFQQSILKAHTQRHPTGLGDVFGHARFDAFQPCVRCPDSRPLMAFGSNPEGRKLLCQFDSHLPLRVMSLGYGDNVDFEQAVLRDTKWLIDTFDCTRPLPPPLDDRQRFFNTCVGNPPSPQGTSWKMEPYQSVVQQQGYTHVDVLKMDVEGTELDFLMNWQLEDLFLPRQLSIELHYSDPPYFMNFPMKTEAHMALLFAHMASLGYAAISRDDNPGATCCSEYTFLRVGVPHSTRVSSEPVANLSPPTVTKWNWLRGGKV